MNATAPSRTPLTENAGLPHAMDENPVVEFPAGIPGFETCRRFVLITSPSLEPFTCLQTLDPPEAAFLAIDPSRVDPSYEKVLREFEAGRLGAGEEPLVWLAIVTVAPDGATANLRAPIVINPRRMLGCQFVRDDAGYSVHAPILQE